MIYILKMILVGDDLYNMDGCATQQHGVIDIAFFHRTVYIYSYYWFDIPVSAVFLTVPFLTLMS